MILGYIIFINIWKIAGKKKKPRKSMTSLKQKPEALGPMFTQN